MNIVNGNTEDLPTTREVLRSEIKRLKKKKNAVLLAHYYQDPEVQDLADFVASGDHAAAHDGLSLVLGLIL